MLRHNTPKHRFKKIQNEKAQKKLDAGKKELIKETLAKLNLVWIGISLKNTSLNKDTFVAIYSLLTMTIEHFKTGNTPSQEDLHDIFLMKDAIIDQLCSSKLRNDFSLAIARKYLTLLYLVSDEVKRHPKYPTYSEHIVALLRLPSVCSEIEGLDTPTPQQLSQLMNLGWHSLTDENIEPKDKIACAGYLQHFLLIQMVAYINEKDFDSAIKHHRLVRAILPHFKNDPNASNFGLYNAGTNLTRVAEQLAKERYYEEALSTCEQALLELKTHIDSFDAKKIKANRLIEEQSAYFKDPSVYCKIQIEQLNTLITLLQRSLREEKLESALSRRMPFVRSQVIANTVTLSFTDVEMFNQFLRQLKALGLNAEVNLTTLEFSIPGSEFKCRYWFLLHAAANNVFTAMDDYNWENDVLNAYPYLHPAFGDSNQPLFFTSMEPQLLKSLPSDELAIKFENALRFGVTSEAPLKKIPTIIKRNQHFEISLQEGNQKHTLFGKTLEKTASDKKNTRPLVIFNQYKAS